MTTIVTRAVLLLWIGVILVAGTAQRSLADEGFPVAVEVVGDGFWPNPVAVGETSSVYLQARPDMGAICEEFGDPDFVGCDFSYVTWRATLASNPYGCYNACTVSLTNDDGFPEVDENGAVFYGVTVDATMYEPGWWAVQIDANAWMYYESDDTYFTGLGTTYKNADEPGLELLVINLGGMYVSARPNNPVALNDTFMIQGGVVGVLDGWAVRYTSRGEPADAGGFISWEKKGHAAGAGAYAKLGDGSPYVQSGITQGDYDVRAYLNLDASRGARPKSTTESREVQAGKLKVKNFSVIQESGSYTRDPDNPVFFRAPDISVEANKIKIKGGLEWDGTPQPANVKQGIIQGIVINEDIRYVGVPVGARWADGAKVGDKIAYWGNRKRTKTSTELNDSDLHHYLYSDSAPKPIGAMVEIFDLPTEVGPHDRIYSVPLIGELVVHYNVSNFALNWDFNDYLVAVVATGGEPQFEPKSKLSWRLHIDGTSDAPKCESVGAAGPPTKPSDGSVTTNNGAIIWEDSNSLNYPYP